jgi:endonuclease/exonuclease/phosphatase (EEP) superfamily protein YafD
MGHWRLGPFSPCHDVVVRKIAGKSLTILLWAGVVVAVPLVGVRWVDSGAFLVAVLQSVVPLAGLLVAVLFFSAAVTRRWRVTVAAGVLLTLCLTIAAPSVLGHEVAPGSQDLVVMSANLQFGRADVQSLVKAAREHRTDVLVLEEITPAAVAGLKAAGLDTLLPESAGQTRAGAGGTIVRSRFPMTLVEPGVDNRTPAQEFNQPVVSIHAASGDVLLRAVHTLPPGVSHAGADWRSGLADLQAWRERQSPDQPLVMAGDFNSSFGHPGFRQVAETMTDVHHAAGEGWVRTWPQGRRLIRPFIALDHVLVRGMGVVEAGVVHLPQTDHAAVWARLSPQVP